MSSTVEIKIQNLNLIREVIRSEGSCTKANLSRITGLSLATCNNFLNEMVESGELLVEQIASQGGRPASLFSFNRDFRHIMCIYLRIAHSVCYVGVTIANAVGEIIRDTMFNPPEINMEYLVSLVQTSVQQDPTIDLVSISVPGNVNHGTIERCDIVSLQGVNIKAEIEKVLPVNVIAENNMNFVAYGFYCESNQAGHSLVAIDFPVHDCVGSGIILHGKIYNGFTRFAGELSNILIENGFPLEKQFASDLNRSDFMTIVTKSVLMVICILNPGQIVLTGDILTEEDIVNIKQRCKAFVSSSHIPSITLSREFNKYCTNGMINAALNSLILQF